MTYSRLEPEYAPAYDAWRAQRTPEAASHLLGALRPAIDRGLRAHVGPQAGPNLRVHARRLALQALETYDPSRARLGTHLVNHLRGLKRLSRRSQQILAVPERLVLDRNYVQECRRQLSDELGRDPSTQELADRTGLSLRRIARVERLQQPMAEGTALRTSAMSEDGHGFQPTVMRDISDVWLEAVYGDLDGTNQRIMEWTLGLHGQPQLSNQQIAAKLRMTPGAISQRKAQIQAKLDQMEKLDLF